MYACIEACIGPTALLSGRGRGENGTVFFVFSVMGLPPYGAGSINMIGAGMESIKLFKSLKGTKDLTIIRKLGNLIYLGKTAPSLLSTFSSATSTISAFNSKNGIEEPKAFSDATSAAQGLEL